MTFGFVEDDMCVAYIASTKKDHIVLCSPLVPINSLLMST